MEVLFIYHFHVQNAANTGHADISKTSPSKFRALVLRRERSRLMTHATLLTPPALASASPSTGCSVPKLRDDYGNFYDGRMGTARGPRMSMAYQPQWLPTRLGYGPAQTQNGTRAVHDGLMSPLANPDFDRTLGTSNPTGLGV